MAMNDAGDELGEPIDFDKEILDEIWDRIGRERLAESEIERDRRAPGKFPEKGETEMPLDLPTEEINRITCEVAMGAPPKKADTPAMAEFRAKMKKGVKDIKDQGYEVQIPNE